MAKNVHVEGTAETRAALRRAEAWLSREVDILVVKTTYGVEAEAKPHVPVLTGALRANVHVEIKGI